MSSGRSYNETPLQQNVQSTIINRYKDPFNRIRLNQDYILVPSSLPDEPYTALLATAVLLNARHRLAALIEYADKNPNINLNQPIPLNDESHISLAGFLKLSNSVEILRLFEPLFPRMDDLKPLFGQQLLEALRHIALELQGTLSFKVTRPYNISYFSDLVGFAKDLLGLGIQLEPDALAHQRVNLDPRANLDPKTPNTIEGILQINISAHPLHSFINLAEYNSLLELLQIAQPPHYSSPSDDALPAYNNNDDYDPRTRLLQAQQGNQEQDNQELDNQERDCGFCVIL